MGAPPSHSTPNNSADSAAKTMSEDPRQILLIELLNQLGLFLNHARHAKGARATAVMFDQIIQRLQTIEKMPGHDGGIILRRIAHANRSSSNKPDYHILCGVLAFRGSEMSVRFRKAQNSAGHLSSVLEQAFGCFAEQGISALFIQFPGSSPERIDQLRLALNIAARFHYAVESSASITFRYFGRAMTIPLINDQQGRPDPNLTLVAGLNGLTSTNMRELVKQAEAFSLLAGKPANESSSFSNYNQIFSVRSLKSQLIRPLVEVNNLPWMTIGGGNKEGRGPDARGVFSGRPEKSIEVREANGKAAPADKPVPLSVHQRQGGVLSPQYLSMYVDQSDRDVSAAMEMLFGTDIVDCRASDIARYLGAATKLLKSMEAHHADADPVARLIAFLYDRLDRLPGSILDGLVPQRQGLKIEQNGKAFLVGMVHPRLLDVLALIKERLLTQRKIEIVKAHALGLHVSQDLEWMRLFGIGKDDCDSVSILLKSCFDREGGFNRTQFSKNIDELAALQNQIFELLWCLLRQTQTANDRVALLNALPPLVARLKDPRGALGFLMADMLQAPDIVEASDRNAFILSNLMLRSRNKESKIDIDHTPEEVLSVRKSLNPDLTGYLVHRIELDEARVQAKFRAIQAHLLRCQRGTQEHHGYAPLSFQFLLTLEREGLIFMALAGGTIGRSIVREALGFYADIHSDLFQRSTPEHLPAVIDHMQLVLRAIARVGGRQDLETLKRIEQSALKLMAMNPDPAHTRQVQRMLKWVPLAMRNIQAQAH